MASPSAAEFLRTALANGSVPVQELQTKARAAELLGHDQSISQCKSFRTIAKRLGIKRFQLARRWLWMLPTAGQTAVAHQVADISGLSVAPGLEGKPPDAVRTAPEPTGPDFARMTRDQFIAWSIANQSALASASMEESKVRVARYLETGDLADLFPQR
jgi:hypothetical protein